MDPIVDKNFLHDLPGDMQKAIESDDRIRVKWEGITTLARNEWICWTTTVKQEKTRVQHIERMKKELLEGKSRPCCWPGCPHRNANAARFIKP